VVAEALKRSPRPPCPTRQAPPPPNTKPWRSDQQQPQQQQAQQQQQQQQVAPAAVGRTVVYESTKECGKEENASNDKNQREDCKQVRSTSDGSIAEDEHSENSGRITTFHEHHETRSERHCPTGKLPVNVRKHNSLTEEQRPQCRLEIIRRNSQGKDQANSVDRGRCKDSSGKDQPREDTNVVVPIEKIGTVPTTKPPVAVRTINVSFEDEHRASSSSPDSTSGRVTVSHEEKCRSNSSSSPESETNEHEARPTPTCRSCSGEQQQQQQHHQQEPFLASGKSIEAVSALERSTSVSSVDRTTTTVLVVEEPERKIASSDLDSNDNDNDNDSDSSNIHRQDWLEAGIRYSSTQITLHGDDGDTIDEDRVNGYDHREEERITDLDFIR